MKNTIKKHTLTNIGDVIVKGSSTGPSVPQKKMKRNVHVDSRITPINFFIVFLFLFTQRYNDIFIPPNLFFIFFPVDPWFWVIVFGSLLLIVNSQTLSVGAR